MQINWSKIETVLLDMDGTLLDLRFDNYFWKAHVPKVYARKNGISPEHAFDQLLPHFQKHMGKLEWYCVDFWSELLDIDIMLHKREVSEKISYRPHAQAFLEKCQLEVNDLRLITNGHRKVLNLKNEFTQINQYFDHCHCSHELDYPKEQQQFWHNLNSIKAFNPQTTLFIDDSESVLESARDYGIEHIYSIEKPDSKNHREKPSSFPMIQTFET